MDGVSSIFSFGGCDHDRAAGAGREQSWQGRGLRHAAEERAGKSGIWHSLVSDDADELALFEGAERFFVGAFRRNDRSSKLLPKIHDPLIEIVVLDRPSDGNAGHPPSAF